MADEHAMMVAKWKARYDARKAKDAPLQDVVEGILMEQKAMQVEFNHLRAKIRQIETIAFHSSDVFHTVKENIAQVQAKAEIAIQGLKTERQAREQADLQRDRALQHHIKQVREDIGHIRSLEKPSNTSLHRKDKLDVSSTSLSSTNKTEKPCNASLHGKDNLDTSMASLASTNSPPREPQDLKDQTKKKRDIRRDSAHLRGSVDLSAILEGSLEDAGQPVKTARADARRASVEEDDVATLPPNSRRASLEMGGTLKMDEVQPSVQSSEDRPRFRDSHDMKQMSLNSLKSPDFGTDNRSHGPLDTDRLERAFSFVQSSGKDIAAVEGTAVVEDDSESQGFSLSTASLGLDFAAFGDTTGKPLSMSWSIKPSGTMRHVATGLKVSPSSGASFGGEEYDLSPEDLEFEEERLGAGATGVVYRGKVKKTGLPVAVKAVRANDKGTRDQLVNEIQGLVRAMGCPYLVQWLGAFVSKDTFEVCVVMELMDLGSLADLKDRLRGDGAPAKYLSGMMQQIMTGLSHLHSKKVLHRDIKPGNILHNAQGEVKLTDFGIAKGMENAPENMAATFVGTLLYMSPERCEGEDYSFSSDIWSIGMVIFELATGRYPYKKGAFPVLWDQLMNEPEPRLPAGEYPANLCDFVASCLVRNVSRRSDAEALEQHPFVRQGLPSIKDLAAWFVKIHGKDAVDALPTSAQLMPEEVGDAPQKLTDLLRGELGKPAIERRIGEEEDVDDTATLTPQDNSRRGSLEMEDVGTIRLDMPFGEKGLPNFGDPSHAGHGLPLHSPAFGQESTPGGFSSHREGLGDRIEDGFTFLGGLGSKGSAKVESAADSGAADSMSLSLGLGNASLGLDFGAFGDTSGKEQ